MSRRLLSLLLVGMQNVDQVRGQGHVKEPPPAAGRLDFDLPKFPVDLAELAPDRVETVAFNIHEDGQYPGAILLRQVIEKVFKITPSAVCFVELDFHCL